MSRPRLTIAAATATGADVKNPKRHANRAAPHATPLGAASAFLEGEARAAWHMFQAEIPWLTESDRAILEVCCVLRARLIRGGDTGLNAAQELRLALSALGATPTTVSKITLPADASPGAEFLT